MEKYYVFLVLSKLKFKYSYNLCVHDFKCNYLNNQQINLFLKNMNTHSNFSKMDLKRTFQCSLSFISPSYFFVFSWDYVLWGNSHFLLMFPSLINSISALQIIPLISITWGPVQFLKSAKNLVIRQFHPECGA